MSGEEASENAATANKYYRAPEHRIFVNRSLHMEKIKFLGFDMDYTLAEYKSPQYEILGFQMLVERLVSLGYPDALRNFEYDASFPIRGLWFDTLYGNLLKVDEYGHILASVHGFHFMNASEINKEYPNKFIQLEESRIYVTNTLFNLPETYMLACMIDFFKNSNEYTEFEEGFRSGDSFMSFKSIFQDIREATGYLHMNGAIKKATVENMERFMKRGPELKILMQRLNQAGKKTFLLTNSEWWYTQKVMQFIMNDEDFLNNFNYVFVDAGKPSFFAEGTVLRQVDMETGRLKIGQHVGAMQERCVYSGGSCDVVSKLMGAKGKDVLYFGDHVHGDVVSSKRRVGWKTFLIVPELNRELHVWTHKHHLFDKLQRLDVKLGEMYRNLDSSASEKPDISHLKKDMAAVIREIGMSYGMLGSPFRSGSRQTFFSAQVIRYADLYAASVLNLLHYPFSYMFSSPAMLMPHESTVSNVINKSQALNFHASVLDEEEEDDEPEENEEPEQNDEPEEETNN